MMRSGLALVWFGSVFHMTLLTLLLLGCWLYCRQYILFFLMSFRSTGDSTILLGLAPAETDLVGFRNCYTGDNSNESDKRFWLTDNPIQCQRSNVDDKVLWWICSVETEAIHGVCLELNVLLVKRVRGARVVKYIWPVSQSNMNAT